MPKVSEVARITTRDGTIWRPCVTCGVLAAMAPENNRCDSCTDIDAPARPKLTGVVRRGWSR
jgi:hypothetical protein